jgi:aminotransferase (EC 2.6.1.-)
MGNPDGVTPLPVVNKMIEAARNPRNHRYSVSRGIPNIRLEICRRYERNYGVQLDPETEAIVTIGAKDALAHLMFAVIGPATRSSPPRPATRSTSTASSWPRGAPCRCLWPTRPSS